MSEEIRKRDGVLDEAHVSVQREERRLSTADLAGTSAGNAHVSFQPRVESDAEDHVVAPSANHPDEIVLERSPGKAETTTGVHSASSAVAAVAKEQPAGPLFSGTEANELRGRWDAVQVGFVDEPRRAVEQADSLVAGTMKRLAEIFAEERGRLESQWDQGENVSTEDLRLALRRYRSFFTRLLSV